MIPSKLALVLLACSSFVHPLVYGQGPVKPPKMIVLTDADSNKTIQAATGNDIMLTLAENPTTGYTWAYKPTSGNRIKLLDHKYTQRPGTERMNGAGGTHAYHFRILKAGATDILLINSRAWEKDQKWARRYRVKIKAK